MKPLYVKKNGVVYRVSGTGIPSIYPAENVEYDNTVTSELQATDVQSAIDELSTREAGVQSDWDEDDSAELDYIKNKPQNLVQDASYVHTDNNYDATAKGKVDALGTAASKNVPTSGNASTTEVVMGDDTRLTDARQASDVSAWAKASTKPTYTASEVGAIASTLKGSVNGVAELDAAGKVPSSQLPSFVDDVIEVADYDHLPITGESGKIYVTLDTNKTYRWTGSGYAEISESLALGETSSTAYRGDRGKTAYDHATETKLSTATASGLYKVAATAQGHIASLTAVEKSDITALGIPAQDTIIKNTAYGTCDTAGDVKDKVATLVNATNWVLEVGTIVGVRFTYTNTCSLSGINLNVNNTGAKNIRYSDGILTSGTDPKCPTAYGEAGQTIYYMYDGTYWVWVSHSKDNDTTYAFEGNTFRSEDGSNYYHGDGTNGNANNMTTNGNYYYKSNGPSTAIGAYGTDGAMFVQAYDSDNVAQIAQNYETGNLFVRGKANGAWTDWKRPSANIISNNTVLTTDKTPFLTRQTLNPTGFSGYVREKLIGASYAWNQILPNGNFADTSVWNASKATISISSNIATLVPNGQSASNIEIYEKPAEKSAKVVGHKYLISLEIKPSQTVNVNLAGFTGGQTRIITSATANSWAKGQTIVTCTTDAIADFYIYSTTESFSTSDSVQVRNIQLIDLTLAFGSTIADYLYGLSNNGGITKLRDMGCPIDKYTPYGYGLYSAKTSGKLIRGFNQWDGIYETGKAIRSADGLIAETGGTLCISDYIPIVGGLNYYLLVKGIGSGGYGFAWYDSGKNYISGTASSGASSTVIGAVTSPSNARYIRFTYNSSYDGVSSICINISDTNKNGQYEPYCGYEISLGNDELRGKFDLVNGEIVASGDVKESNGEITRNYSAEYILETKAGLNTSGTHKYALYYPTGIKSVSGAIDDCVCDKLSFVSSMGDYFGYYHASNMLVVCVPDNYTVEQYNANVAGNKLLYPLATPTTEQSTPFADPMSMVGATTEEYIDTRDIPCPVGAERQYMGQSEDVVEIPSGSLSDGKRKLVAETSGGKTQYYWEDYVDDKPRQAVIESLLTYTSVSNKYTFPVDGYVHLQILNGATAGDYITIGLYDSQNVYVTSAKLISASGSVDHMSIFVKRGMKVFISGMTEGQDKIRAAFRGIT